MAITPTEMSVFGLILNSGCGILPMILSLSTLTHCKQWLKSLAQKSGFYISRAPMVNLEGFALVDFHIANNDGASSSVFQFSEELGIPNLSMTNSESHSNSGTVCEENRY